MPFNWPAESFVTNGSTSAKLTLAFVCLAVFIFPVFGSCGLHLMLLYAKAFKDKNKVGAQVGLELGPKNKVEAQVCHLTNPELETKNKVGRTNPEVKEILDRNVEHGSQKDVGLEQTNESKNLNSDSIEQLSTMDQKQVFPHEEDKIVNVELKEESSDLSDDIEFLENGSKSKSFMNSDQEALVSIVQVEPSNNLIDSKIEIKVNPIQEDIFPSDENCENSKLEIEMKKESRKVEAEIESAIRSLKTNLILIFLLFFLVTFFLFSPLDFQLYFIATIESLQKSLLPILTTMANFSPIRLVVSKYFNYFKDKFTQND